MKAYKFEQFLESLKKHENEIKEFNQIRNK